MRERAGAEAQQGYANTFWWRANGYTMFDEFPLDKYR
jgi:hypothetical protein